MARVTTLIVLFGLMPLTASCAPDLGACDDALARTAVYTDDAQGLPAYSGQALLHRSCGAGVYCHSERAVGVTRYGAPFGLDFDMGPATDAESTERLRRGLAQVLDHDGAILSELDDELMPPMERGDEIRDFGPVYVGLPEIDTPEGREILRNWLACGAPVVERIADDRPAGVAPVGDVVPAMPR